MRQQNVSTFYSICIIEMFIVTILLKRIRNRMVVSVLCNLGECLNKMARMKFRCVAHGRSTIAPCITHIVPHGQLYNFSNSYSHEINDFWYTKFHILEVEQYVLVLICHGIITFRCFCLSVHKQICTLQMANDMRLFVTRVSQM